MTSAPVIRRSPHSIWRVTSSALVVAVPPSPAVLVSGSGALVWDELAQPSTVDEVVGRLAAAVATPPAQIADDVRRLVDDLLHRGVLETVDAVSVAP